MTDELLRIQLKKKHKEHDSFIIDSSIELLVLLNVDDGVPLTKSDKLDEDDCIALFGFA